MSVECLQMRPDSGPLCTLRAKQPPEGRPALRPGRGAAVWDPGPCARRCPSAPDLRGEEAAGPSEGPPDGDVPGTAGQAPPLPFGLYLTGLEALRRSHSFSKGIWFRARVISQNPLAFDTPPPPRYPPPFPFCLPPLSPDDRSAVFRGVALARAQGIPTAARFPVWTGFQRCDQGCFPGDTSL